MNNYVRWLSMNKFWQRWTNPCMLMPPPGPNIGVIWLEPFKRCNPELGMAKQAVAKQISIRTIAAQWLQSNGNPMRVALLFRAIVSKIINSLFKFFCRYGDIYTEISVVFCFAKHFQIRSWDFSEGRAQQKHPHNAPHSYTTLNSTRASHSHKKNPNINIKFCKCIYLLCVSSYYSFSFIIFNLIKKNRMTLCLHFTTLLSVSI